ncbi:MAG: DNA methylase [Magnetococcales bacterium]|nr:DNA methylase [Magnetococcales bacterium]
MCCRSLADERKEVLVLPIENQFDVPFIARMALKEKQVQQNYRPIIAVHKWFARRPGTLFRGLLLSEFGEGPVADAFFRSHTFPGIKVADPFMGGGTPLLEANRIGCDVTGFDINPMSAWIVHEEIEHLDLPAYHSTAEALLCFLEQKVGGLQTTCCTLCGHASAPAKSYLWVKTLPCEECGRDVNLFPGFLVAKDRRHIKNVLLCPQCGELCEVDDSSDPGTCRVCHGTLGLEGVARKGHCNCHHCGRRNTYPRPDAGPPDHRMFAIEYHCHHCKVGHKGRFFKKPDPGDLEAYALAERQWQAMEARFVPVEDIPLGDETGRLHRWGYRRYRDMFNARQLLGLEWSARFIEKVGDARIRRALATNLSDLLRYQNMLCRYDVMALKALDIFSIHGFPVGLVQCESNLLGIANGRGVNVGSGGWRNIIDKYSKAKAYCDHPFEVDHRGSRKVQIPIHGEWIGEARLNGKAFSPRQVQLQCQSATTADLPENSLDAVFTDPPYFGNVQYGELMDFCFVWLKRLARDDLARWGGDTSKHADELTGNVTQERGLEHFTTGLSMVYSRMAKALKPGAPLAFTYHHNRLEVYGAVGVAILDAGLICSTSIPCPAEMGGSIHIHGTGSSIVDTVFVCRKHGHVDARQLFYDTEQLLDIVDRDLEALRLGGVQPTLGDIRCILFGHLTRMGVWNLRKTWEPGLTVEQKLHRFTQALQWLPDFSRVLDRAGKEQDDDRHLGGLFAGRPSRSSSLEGNHAVSF